MHQNAASLTRSASKIRPKVSNRLFGLATSDAKGVAPLAALAAAEPFADVRGNRLRGVSQLRHVDESARRLVNESIDLVRHLVRRVEDREISMIGHAPR
jgi:hypothetical protein